MKIAAAWTAYPYDNAAYRFDAAALADRWPALHAGDAEPLPDDPRLLAAWSLFHAGEFEQAVRAGLRAAAEGLAGGMTVANKAELVYASYLEPSERTKIAMFHEVAARAQAHIARHPRDAGAHYELAVALGRCVQGLSVSKAMTRGMASRIKAALETTLALAPLHGDAYLALGTFHAEMIDKVGSLLGRTQGASKDAGITFLREGLRLNPASAIAKLAAANALIMLDGEGRLKEAERLYAEAAASTPLDAVERLGAELAKAELED
jgi:tetratricopeptide (TPR) repeat protein